MTFLQKLHQWFEHCYCQDCISWWGRCGDSVFVGVGPAALQHRRLRRDAAASSHSPLAAASCVSVDAPALMWERRQPWESTPTLLRLLKIAGARAAPRLESHRRSGDGAAAQTWSVGDVTTAGEDSAFRAPNMEVRKLLQFRFPWARKRGSASEPQDRSGPSLNETGRSLTHSWMRFPVIRAASLRSIWTRFWSSGTPPCSAPPPTEKGFIQIIGRESLPPYLRWNAVKVFVFLLRDLPVSAAILMTSTWPWLTPPPTWSESRKWWFCVKMTGGVRRSKRKKRDSAWISEMISDVQEVERSDLFMRRWG